MFKIAALALMAAALVAEANAGAETNWPSIAKALDNIPSEAGVPVLKRIESCHFTVLKDASFIETRNVPWPEYDAKAGQTVLKVTIQLPLYKGERPSDNEPMPAVWIIDHGKATALSHWAILLQTKPVPMGYDNRLKC